MADYEGVLADLKVKRAALDRERGELDTVIAGIERLISGQVRTQVPAALPSVSIRAFSGLTMPQALTKCLKLARQPQTKRQIQETLKAGGMRTGKSFSAHVYNTLHRLSGSDGLFRRESDGRWGLREWQAVTIEPENATPSASTAH